MKKIVLLSDTHSHFDNRIIPYLENLDEIWHAGDIGNISILNSLEQYAPVKAVFGNIDDHAIRKTLPEMLEWDTEGMSILMTHIGGRPPSFEKGIKELLTKKRPNIFICGHSHILLVQYVEELDCLLLNPGACGKSGWHKKQTILKFEIDSGAIKHMNVIEFDRKSTTNS
jgi:putative phosphoesterase